MTMNVDDTDPVKIASYIKSASLGKSGVPLIDIIQRVKEYFCIDLYDYAYKHGCGGQRSVDAVASYIKKIENAHVERIQSRGYSGGYYIVTFELSADSQKAVAFINTTKSRKNKKNTNYKLFHSTFGKAHNFGQFFSPAKTEKPLKSNFSNHEQKSIYTNNVTSLPAKKQAGTNKENRSIILSETLPAKKKYKMGSYNFPKPETSQCNLPKLETSKYNFPKPENSKCSIHDRVTFLTRSGLSKQSFPVSQRKNTVQKITSDSHGQTVCFDREYVVSSQTPTTFIKEQKSGFTYELKKNPESFSNYFDYSESNKFSSSNEFGVDDNTTSLINTNISNRGINSQQFLCNTNNSAGLDNGNIKIQDMNENYNNNQCNNNNVKLVTIQDIPETVFGRSTNHLKSIGILHGNDNIFPGPGCDIKLKNKHVYRDPKVTWYEESSDIGMGEISYEKEYRSKFVNNEDYKYICDQLAKLSIS